MYKLLTLTRIITVRFLRDKTAMFFTILFPLVFLVVFGLIFRNNNGGTFNVAVFNDSKTEFAGQFIGQLKESKNLKIKDIASKDKADEKLSRGELDAYFYLDSNFGQVAETGPSGSLEVNYSKSNEQTGQTVSGVMQNVLGEINQSISPYNAPFEVKTNAKSIANISRFDYTLSGLIGFSLMSLGIFGIVNGFVGDKKTGAIARLRVTPLKAWELIVATALNRVVIAMISVTTMIITSMLIFGFRMQGNWPSFIFLVVLSSTLMLGIGLALGGWAKSEEQAAPLANLVTFPMMFLSGVFFPTYIMPEWLQSASRYIPLTPVVDGFRQIITEGRTLFDLGSQLLIIAVWTIIAFVIAGKVFRWE